MKHSPHSFFLRTNVINNFPCCFIPRLCCISLEVDVRKPVLILLLSLGDYGRLWYVKTRRCY